jgi:hypothetical protein
MSARRIFISRAMATPSVFSKHAVTNSEDKGLEDYVRPVDGGELQTLHKQHLNRAVDCV